MKNLLYIGIGFVLIFTISALMLRFVSLNPLSQFLFAFAAIASVGGAVLTATFMLLLVEQVEREKNQQNK